jgi:hypothetical protein
MSTQITDKRFLMQLFKDLSEGDLTAKEVVEQIADMQQSLEEQPIEAFFMKTDDATLGKLLRTVFVASVYDVGWEGYTRSDRASIMRWLADLKICLDNGILETPIDADTDRSKGGAVPDGA